LPGVELHRVPLLGLDLLRRLRPAPGELEARLERALGEAVAARGLQVVHGHNLHHFFAAPALALEALRQGAGLRLHHTFHETWPDLLHQRPVYRRWDGNYAVSRFVQEECAQRIGFRPKLKPLGVDTRRFRPHRPPMAPMPPIPPMSGREDFVILHPARLLPWKGVHLSVAMLAELRRRRIPARLVVTDTQRIVDWDEELARYRREVIEQIEAQGVADRVELRAVGYADMPRLYDEADVVVYPTVGQEPYGLVPLEAMSMARPVVGSRSGGISETIVDGETGFLVERGDTTALADRVARLLLDSELCRRMGEAGRRHVVARFDGSQYAARLLGDYLLPGAGVPPLHAGA
jgi:glycosyltransferase involved in cell wall biosynthesis